MIAKQENDKLTALKRGMTAYNEDGERCSYEKYAEKAPTLFRFHIEREVAAIDTKKAGVLLATASDAYLRWLWIQNDIAQGVKPRECDIKAVQNWNELCEDVIGRCYSWEEMQQESSLVLFEYYPFVMGYSCN